MGEGSGAWYWVWVCVCVEGAVWGGYGCVVNDWLLPTLRLGRDVKFDVAVGVGVECG